MAFTKSLYYPRIDIQDESWLKNAALYWQEIQTIVPEGIEHPYGSDTALALQDAEILSPFRVNSNLNQIKDLVPDVIKYLRSEEGMQILTRADRRFVNLHPEKLPQSIHHLSHLHPQKMAYEIEHLLGEFGFTRPGNDGFLEVDEQFSEFYMTLLATKISDSIGAGMVTSSVLPHNLSIKVKTDSTMPRISSGYEEDFEFRRRNNIAPRELAQGLLVELTMEKLSLDPETPVNKILEYREKHSSELGRFRKMVGELTSSLPDEATLPAMQQHVNDIYLNEVQPSIDDLKKSLKANRLNFLTNNWIKMAFISAGPSSMLAGMGLASTNALLVGAGVSLVGTGILYNTDKAKMLRDNPYSYLVGLEKSIPR